MHESPKKRKRSTRINYNGRSIPRGKQALPKAERLNRWTWLTRTRRIGGKNQDNHGPEHNPRPGFPHPSKVGIVRTAFCKEFPSGTLPERPALEQRALSPTKVSLRPPFSSRDRITASRLRLAPIARGGQSKQCRNTEGVAIRAPKERRAGCATVPATAPVSARGCHRVSGCPPG